MSDFYYWLDELAQMLDQCILPEMTDEQIAVMVLPAVMQAWKDRGVTEQLVPGGKIMEEQWSASMRGSICEVHVRQRIMPPIHLTVTVSAKEFDG